MLTVSQQLVPYLDELYNFLATVGFKLLQEDKLAIYEAIGWIISSMPMDVAAATLRKFAIDIFAAIQLVSGDSQQSYKTIVGEFREPISLTACIYLPGRWV